MHLIPSQIIFAFLAKLGMFSFWWKNESINYIHDIIFVLGSEYFYDLEYTVFTAVYSLLEKNILIGKFAFLSSTVP